MKVSVAIQILPKVNETEEIIRIVDEVIDYIKSTGLNYYVGPSETSIEGEDFDQLMEVLKNCHKVAIEAGAPAVSGYIKTNFNPNKNILTIDEKISKYNKDEEK